MVAVDDTTDVGNVVYLLLSAMPFCCNRQVEQLDKQTDATKHIISIDTSPVAVVELEKSRTVQLSPYVHVYHICTPA